MDSHPSQSGRSSAEDTYSHSPGSSDNIFGRTSSSSWSDASSQSLASILNNPHVGKSGVYGLDGSWAGWWYSSSTTVHLPEFSPLPNMALNEVNRSDFQQYLSSIVEPYSRFEDIRVHTGKEYLDLENVGCQGEALVSCLREVPALYFKEDFALEDGPTFLAACPFSVMSENVLLQEKLSQYLDVIEMHLVKEISLRSNSFFEAQGQLEDLNVKIVEGCDRIRDLKETIRLLDVDLVDSARHVQELNATRSNLLMLQQKLRLILYVNQALSALKSLVASVDCAGALDVIDDMRHLLDGDALAGLHCFRHLRDHVAASIDSVNSILSAEFLHGALHDAADIDRMILSNAKAKARARLSILEYVNDGEVVSDKDEISNFQERLFPVIIGLLRVGKLPYVLRIYRDRLTADMKTAIKTAVAELLPVLVAQFHDSVFTTGQGTSDADGGGLSLASKLRSLSSESFVQLLSTIFMIVEAHLARAGHIKKSVEWIMSNLDGHYAANSVASAISLGATLSEASRKTDDESCSLLSNPHQKNSFNLSYFIAKENDVASPSNMSRSFRADVLRENTEAVFASCDAAHGRWAKLLGVRALLHPKLRLHEFLSIYWITEKFISATEKIGGRLGYSIRGTLQSQAKAFVYCQHESRMAKMKAVLEQETWAEFDVPDEFQAIITLVLCSEHDASENLITNNIVSTDMPSNDNGSISSVAELPKFQQPNEQCTPLEVLASEKSKTDVINPSAQINVNNNKEREKTTTQTLSYKGVSYHMVNCGLILLKMLSEYIEMNKSLPSLSSEVVLRVTEILKFFNTRTCQLVLGTGALQVAGLRSITSKHLALASQVISFTFAIIPEIQRLLFLKLPESRKSLLLYEIDRVAQDYMVHRDEIHSKLVQITRERLLFHLRGLPQIVERWNRLEDNDSQPSQFARSLTKEVAFLQRVLSRILHEVDVQEIFRQVVIIFHSQISEAFSHLEITTPHAKNNLYRDTQHILGCIRSLPSHDLRNSGIPNTGLLDEFLLQRFSDESSQQIHA